MPNYRTRTDHRPAILAFLKRGPAHLATIIGHLKADDAHRAVEYDIKCLRQAGVIRTWDGRWQLITASKRRTRTP